MLNFPADRSKLQLPQDFSGRPKQTATATRLSLQTEANDADKRGKSKGTAREELTT
jgi:hypothetical protein